ncbi:MAG: hypothetical protein JSV22_00435 [Bacteroidales bacterium]|nr:MAG: hypothetical protein JSV22_00435 [Bacteroidales bacterium]
MRIIIISLLNLLVFCFVKAQPVPAGDENIPYLMTFGANSETSWGDDDFSQTFFFSIPKDFNEPVFIRVYDPDIGGEIDEINGIWDTKTTYSVYGGKGSYTHKDAQETSPAGNYKSGNLLASKTFGEDPKYDKGWYTFGPFNPTEGEFVSKFEAYIIKVIADGVTGDDGNLYRYYLSTRYDVNIQVEGGNAFAYEYSFRLYNDENEVSHIYPYVDDRTITVKLSNFDWDNDGFIRTVSVARKGQLSKVSNEDVWVEDEFKIFEEEKNTSLDIQFIKSKNPVVRNNNVVVNVRNQYGELLPFYVIPIGGVPKYKYSIGAKKASQR